MIVDVVDFPEYWLIKKGAATKQFSEALAAPRGVILYHSTSSRFLESILRQGVLPRSATGNSVYRDMQLAGEDLESNPNLVYLSTRSDLYAAAVATSRFGGEGAYVRIHVTDTGKLAPDEDAKVKTWQESVVQIGTCAHIGPISPANILGWGLTKFNKKGAVYVAVQEDPQGITTLTVKPSSLELDKINQARVS